MPRGAKPGERRGGRVAGTLNKTTQERLLRQAIETHDAQKNGKKLAKEVLDDLMHLCAGMAAAYQPNPPGMPDTHPNSNPYASEEKFWKCVEMTRDFAVPLAKYQSPTFRAIMVHASPDQLEPRRGPDGAKQVEGKVIDLQDADALVRVYKRRIAGVKG